jgi:sialidase-1
VKISVQDSGNVYANPKPHLRSRQSIFPTVARMPDGRLLASYTVGEAFESVDMHTELSQSLDEGRTWEPLGNGPRTVSTVPLSESGRLTALGSKLLCYTPRFDRSDPERSIGNGATNGLVECDGAVYRSEDGGATWEGPIQIPIPVPGPYEIACPIVPLSDGRCLALFSTWRNWEGVKRTPERTLAMVSSDEGATWPEMLTLFADPAEQIVYWEARVIEISHGRLLAVAWAHNHGTGRDLPNQFAISNDGRNFGPARSTGLPGQTCTPFWLGDGRLLCVYNHRFGEPGVRASLVWYSETEEWLQEETVVLWGQQGRSAAARTVVGGMNQFRFGYPTLTRLSRSDFLVTFWCMEEAQLVSKWVRISVS